LVTAVVAVVLDAAINDRIRYVNSHTISGPTTTVGVLDVEERSSDGDSAREPTAADGSER